MLAENVGGVNAMRVLMLESHAGLGSDVVARLTAAGHSIVRCDSTDRSFPCRGIAPDQGCPLDEPVDVAVLAHEPGLLDVEHGALCAARQRIPIVEVAPSRFEPVASVVSVTTVDGEDIVAVCEQAANDGRVHAAAVIGRLLQLGVATSEELDPDRGTVGIEVVRSGSRLRLMVVLDLSVASRETEIVRAAQQALRAFDRQTRVIDVTVRQRPTC
jgi:phage baseplate assembly protein W